ncbi:MAG TPA: hypothetical protein VH538_04870 [Gaiellaceae bacterium]
MTSVYVRGGLTMQTARGLALQQTLVIWGEVGEFRLFDDDSTARWRSETPRHRSRLSMDARPNTYETRFVRSAAPGSAIESLWAMHIADTNQGKVVRFDEVAFAEPEGLGSTDGWSAIVTWQKIHD